MSLQIGHPLAALLILGGLVGCRAVLGIHEDAPQDAVDAAGPDALEDAGPPGNPFCKTLSPAQAGCRDFEEGDLFAGWDNEGQTPNPGLVGGGTFEELLGVDGRKLGARLPPMVGSTQHASAVLIRTMPLAQNVGLSAKLTIVTEEIPGPKTLVLMSIVFGDEGAVVVYRDQEGAAVAVVPDGKAARFPSWPAGVSRVISVLVATAPKPSAQASIDGDFGPELVLPAHFANARTRRILLGPTADAPMGETKITIDDVIVF